MDSNLTAMEPYRPIFIALTLLFLGLAFRKVISVPQVCTPGHALRRSAARFSGSGSPSGSFAVLLLVLLAVPWLAPLFY